MKISNKGGNDKISTFFLHISGIMLNFADDSK